MRYGSLSVDRLETWALLNNANCPVAQVTVDILDHDGKSKGGGLTAKRAASAGELLLKVPAELVVNQTQIEMCSKADTTLQNLMEATATFAKTPRLTILVFLLYQMILGSPDAIDMPGNKQSPAAGYMRFLPKDIPLPTFYTEEERATLVGTSLAHALEQKLASLEREFEQLKEATSHLPWARKIWWDEQHGILDLQDWKLVDAMYRSRALELPRGVGDSMVPILDMANHASDNRSNARFEIDSDGNVVLLVREDKAISAGEEITIMYGVGGACEMIFSYGFLEQGASSAREMFLPTSIPEDDPLRLAKIRYAREAPGVRIFVDAAGEVCWDSDYTWWSTVNEEDGLDFRIMQTTDGQRELQASWKEQDFAADDLKGILMADGLRDVFSLRATVLVQQRLEAQGQELAESEVALDDTLDKLPAISHLVSRLRELELDLVTAGFLQLGTKKDRLMQCPSVRSYLGDDNPQGVQPGEEEDFS